MICLGIASTGIAALANRYLSYTNPSFRGEEVLELPSILAYYQSTRVKPVPKDLWSKATNDVLSARTAMNNLNKESLDKKASKSKNSMANTASQDWKNVVRTLDKTRFAARNGSTNSLIRKF